MRSPKAVHKEMLEKGRQIRPSDIDPRYVPLKTLGHGYEGYIYLVRDQLTGRKLVLKVFHEPFTREGVLVYADRVKSSQYGLHEITLTQAAGKIIALHYPYEKLFPVDFRWPILPDCTRQALVGQFCLMQWYLMSQHGLGIIDPVTSNFMMADDGQFHYIDYGLGLRTVTDSGTLARGFFGYGFAMLLLSIYNINLRVEMPFVLDYAYDRPCIYSQCGVLDRVADRHLWIRKILSEVRNQNATILLDPVFYWRLGMSLRQHVCFPYLVIATTQFMNFLRRARNRAWPKNS